MHYYSLPKIVYTSLVILPLAIIFSCQDQAVNTLPDFRIHPDFELELAAAEPLVFDPVDMEFDEFGRAFVLEMPGYPLRDAESRLVLLIDEDKDGRYDKRQVFADSLYLASSFMPYKGGMLVASPPQLLYLKDEDGDLVADKREVLMEGFEVGNLQHNFNGLTYALDNWIYAANGGNSGAPYFVGEGDRRLDLRGDDFRFDLENKIMERVGKSSGGFELAFDNWGRMYETHNLEHVSQLIFEGKYIEGLPIASSHSLKVISDHEEHGLARIYPIGAQDTRVNHPEQSGYFSGACGITFYGGASFPNGFNDNLYVADVVLNLIHMDVLSADGTHSVASRNRDKVEFLASTDRAFRPVNMTTGPDGALYVLDMHRAVIEHPEWIPDEIETQLDLGEGKDKGRIYRIKARGETLSASLPFDTQNLSSLVQALGNENQWVRMTAQRLLVERGGKEEIPALEELVNSSTQAFARLHALWTLEGMGLLAEKILIKGLEDVEPGVRENAIRMAESHLKIAPKLASHLIDLCKDKHPRVRMRAALSLGQLEKDTFLSYAEEITAVCKQVLKGPNADIWTSTAIASAMQQDAHSFSQQLLAGDLGDAERETLGILSRFLSKKGELPAIESILETIASMQNLAVKDKAEVVSSITSTWNSSNSTAKLSASGRAALEKLEKGEDAPLLAACGKFRKTFTLPTSPRIRNYLKTARVHVFDETNSLEERKELLALIGLDKFDAREDLLYRLLKPRQSLELQEAAMLQLWEANDPAVAQKLLSMWPELGPDARKNASNIFLYKSYNHDLLLSALEKKEINLGELNLDLERRRVLLWSEDAQIKQRAEALFSDAGVVQRKEAIAQMRPALELAGNKQQGQRHFQNHCGSCHRYGDLGKEVGPTLTEIHRKSKTSLLHDILDPNAAVDPKYLAYEVYTQEGNIFSGIIYEESDAELVLRTITGQEQRIAKKEIEKLRSTGYSLMPEGLEAQLSPDEFADLLAFLQEN